MSKAPHSRQHLVGSKWSAAQVEERRKHWEVVELDGKEHCVLRAVIDGERRRLAWRELRDRDQWAPGWQ